MPFPAAAAAVLAGIPLSLLICLLSLLSPPFADLMPQHYTVHFFRSPNGKWLSLLNLKVVVQSPDVEDFEEQRTREFMDFDDDDDWTVIELDPIPPPYKARNEAVLEKEKEEEIGMKEDSKAMNGEDYLFPNDNRPELTSAKEQGIVPWVPHKIRHHYKVKNLTASLTSTKSKPAAVGGKTELHLEDIISTTVKGNLSFNEVNETESQNDKQMTVAQETDDLAELELKKAPIGDGMDWLGAILGAIVTNESSTTTKPMTALEPINEEELALNLHKDSLNRDQVELRELLTNVTKETKLEEQNGSSEAYRDFGGSFILPLLKELDYDNKSIPLVFADEPLQIGVSFEVIHLGNFDNVQMEYELDVLFHLHWYDVRLANNFSKPVRIREQSIMDRIWKPDAVFLNSKYSFFHLVSFPNFRMRIQPDGHVKYTSRYTLLPDCQMSFCNFPHDTQRCGLFISSIAHPQSMLQFKWDSPAIVFNKKISLPDLRIQRIDSFHCQLPGKLIPSPCLAISFTLKRAIARFIAEKYVPSTLAMIFSWVAPYVPYNYEEVRIITPITVLLTLVQMEKGNQEVITSYLTSLDIWFVMIKAFTVLSLVESLTVMAYIKKARAVEKQAQRQSNEYHKELLQAEAKRIVRIYHRMDHISRVLSPVAFTLFLLYYMAFIAKRDELGCQEVWKSGKALMD